MLKPLCITLVIWGETHCDYFLEYCLPSLLSPNNLPALKLGQENKILLCVDRVAWTKIINSAIYKYAIQFVAFTPFFVPPGDRPFDQHIYHTQYLSPYMQENSLFGCHLCPDVIVSDGSLKKLEEKLEQGYQIILAQVPLRTNPSFLNILHTRGLIAAEQWPMSKSASALQITSRQIVDVILDSTHFASIGCEWGREHFHSIPANVWWKIPRERGYISYSFSWMLVGLDYGIADEIRLDNNVTGMDGHYMDRHFYHKAPKEKIHIFHDSDDFMVVSWCDYSVGLAAPRPAELKSKFRGFIYRISKIRAVHDDKKQTCKFKRDLFNTQLYAHADDINSNWYLSMCWSKFIMFCIKSNLIFPTLLFIEKIYLTKDRAVTHMKSFSYQIKRVLRWLNRKCKI